MSEHTAGTGMIRVGDRIRFEPHGGRRWWTVRDRDERFIVATAQAPFKPKGELWYTVVDLTGWQDKCYNGAGNGIVRSSLNTLGGGWNTDDEGLAEIIPALRSGEWELSHRRVANVWSIERESDRRCAEHDEALIWEPGGDDMPTLCGRWYCASCQERFMRVLDSLPPTRVLPPAEGRAEEDA